MSRSDGSQKITVDVVKRYTELNKQIRDLERRNARKKSQEVQQHLKNAVDDLQTCRRIYNECAKKTKREKADIDVLQSELKKTVLPSTSKREQYTKEQAEYVEALAKQEKACRDVKRFEEKQKYLQAVVESCREEFDKLEALTKENYQFLASIFDGKHGSQEENRLEKELEKHMERRQRIEIALNKWKNGKCLLEQAVYQLGDSVRLWTAVGNMPDTEQQKKYDTTTKCRNNILAAIANISNCHRFLQNIKFPYCNQDEMLVLTAAANNIYIEMGTPKRHSQALSCYDANYRRCAALLQWFESVISGTIEKNLHEAVKKARETEKLLRKERVRLLKEKIESSGEKCGCTNELEAMIDDDDDDAIADSELAKLFKPEGTKSDDQLSPCNKDKLPALTPLPQSELAPPPSEEDVFGN